MEGHGDRRAWRLHRQPSPHQDAEAVVARHDPVGPLGRLRRAWKLRSWRTCAWSPGGRCHRRRPRSRNGVVAVDDEQRERPRRNVRRGELGTVFTGHRRSKRGTAARQHVTAGCVTSATRYAVAASMLAAHRRSGRLDDVTELGDRVNSSSPPRDGGGLGGSEPNDQRAKLRRPCPSSVAARVGTACWGPRAVVRERQTFHSSTLR